MGAGASKQEPAGAKHVFASDTPVQFSHNLVESLQSSSETDSTRSKSLELHIQARVAEELRRLRERETQTLADLEKRLADVEANPVPPPSAQLDLDAPRVPFAGRGEANPEVAAANERRLNDSELGRESVLKEIATLRSRLESRRTLKELDENVEKARDEMVSCLRLKDRRPLDCWEQVDGFKKEVAKLEKSFVDRVVG